METKEKVACYKRPDGGVSIIHFAHNVYVPVDGPSGPDDFKTIGADGDGDPEGYRKATIKELVQRDSPLGVEIFIVDADDPHLQDRHFRNAWDHDKGTLFTDMVRAREIHKENLRQERKPLLESLDIAYLIALEKGDNAEIENIKKHKNILRDVTKHPDIASASTPEELKIAAVSVLEIQKQ